MSYNVEKGKNGTSSERKEFRTFEDLEVYQVAREFRKKMYAVTRRLPDFEKYDLGSQIRRAAVSLTNNIAEGHGRYHFAEAKPIELPQRTIALWPFSMKRSVLPLRFNDLTF